MIPILAVLLSGFFAIFAWWQERKSGRLEIANRLRRSGSDAWTRPIAMRFAIGGCSGAVLAFWLWKRPDLMTLSAMAMAVLCYIHISIVRRTLDKLREEVIQCNYRICPDCLYPLEGLGDFGKCPECGFAFTSESLVAKWKEICRTSSSVPTGGRRSTA